MRLPKSFNEVTVKQYQDVYFLIREKYIDDFQYCENWARVISILSNEDYDTILELPKIEFKNLIKRIDFILRPEVLQERAKKYIAVNRRFYKAVLNADQLSTSQSLNIKGFQSRDNSLDINENTVVEMHNLLATIYLPLTLKGFKYSSEKHRKIAEDMLHAKMGDVYGTLFFYSVLYENLMKSTVDSMNENLSVLTDHLNEIQERMQEKSLEKSGAGR
jgi:hypothetical protein